MVSELNGIAIFKDKRLAGFLTPDESNAYLYATDGIKGGLLVFPFHGKKDDTTIEISSSKTKTSFRVEDGKIKIKIKTETQGFLDEHMGLDQDFSKKDIARMEDIAAAKIEHNVSNLIKKIQSEYDSDIFGFGNLIHKRDYKLWKQLEDNWPALFKDIEVEVSSKVHIEDTSTMK
jgi:spore germination protein KC